MAKAKNNKSITYKGKNQATFKMGMLVDETFKSGESKKVSEEVFNALLSDYPTQFKKTPVKAKITEKSAEKSVEEKSAEA